MISVESLTFVYPGRPPLFQDFDWRVEPGERWAVIGPSGCGKTTLLYLIAGLRQPTNGVVRVAGVPVTRGEPVSG
ncbi:MAG: ATP-binding cassette domain-containing protein [Chloroflexi bacterium]|nr:ATP-binding cassette domain-containing protein [Chloroflexota bacterium]